MKKGLHFRALLWVLILLLALPIGVQAESTQPVVITALQTVGFSVDFSSDTDYYLAFPESFSGLKIKKVTTNIPADVEITVEPYLGTNYTVAQGDDLALTFGRTKVHITVTDKANEKNKKTYMLALADAAQEGYRYCFLAEKTTVYKTASTSAKVITTLNKSTATSSMPFRVRIQGKWSQILIPSSKGDALFGVEGWVETKNLVEEYPLTTMPVGYKKAITELQKKYPNWTFEYRHMNVDMDDYAKTIADIYSENKGGASAVEIKEVLQAMDPANYLNEKHIFMFLDVNSYESADYTAKGIKALWNEYAGAVITEAQAVDHFLNAGNSLKINSYFLTARAALESGHGTSKLSKGIAGTDGRLYYNFYGIKAYDRDPILGAYYAEQRGWDTPLRSIVEGANWIADQYIQRGQNTPYFFRYYPYRKHLYMSDLYAPRKDAENLYKCYSGAGKMNSNLHFIIPVFEFRYTDVKAKDWFYEDVYRALQYKLMDGVGDGAFAPNDTMTRAQFVTVLGRMSGIDDKKYSTDQFTDVPKKKWYTGFVAWGYESGIVNGMSKTLFEPDRPISRQDLCTMLSRYAKKQGIALTTAPLTFSDKADIGKWAKTAVAECVGAGLVGGMGDGTFLPKANATRAQGAKILSLFYEKFILK